MCLLLMFYDVDWRRGGEGRTGEGRTGEGRGEEAIIFILLNQRSSSFLVLLWHHQVFTIFVYLIYPGANNGLPDVMALMLVEGYVKLVLTLGPHPNAPLELYMNRGDRLDDRQWHTVEIIRSLKVGKSFHV